MRTAMLPSYSLSEPAVAAFIAIPLGLTALIAWAAHATWQRAGATPAVSRRAAASVLLLSAIWLASTWFLAGTGVLAEFDRTPPPLALLVLAVLAIAFALAFSRIGGRLASHLPLWVLVAAQSFRLPLEIAMHAMAVRGIMPSVMSYTGRNLDILSGISAILVAALVRSGYGGRRLVAAWNVMGLALLANIMIVAILATPRFQYFGAGQLNVWVMHPPFVWLPAVMVLAALAGHLIVFRALVGQSSIAHR